MPQGARCVRKYTLDMLAIPPVAYTPENREPSDKTEDDFSHEALHAQTPAVSGILIFSACLMETLADLTLFTST